MRVKEKNNYETMDDETISFEEDALYYGVFPSAFGDGGGLYQSWNLSLWGKQLSSY